MKASSLFKISLTSTDTLHYIWLLKMGTKKWWIYFCRKALIVMLLTIGTILHYIELLRMGHAYVPRTLLYQGSHIYQTDKWGNTCLHRSSQNGHTSTVELLLRNGANSHIANQLKIDPSALRC